MNKQKIESIITDFVETSPENSLFKGNSEPAWMKPLVGFSAGDDPIYLKYKEGVGPFHFTPQEIFNLTFPDNPFL